MGNSLSIELGLPYSISQDAVHAEDLNRAAFPAYFKYTIRIALESAKINRLVDLKVTKDINDT
jgi:hypothetical protein